MADHELTRVAAKVRQERETFRGRGMTPLAESEGRNQIAEVRFDDERMHVLLQDGREISVPPWWYPRLLHAMPEQREKWEILPFGDAPHWEEIDGTWMCGAF